MSRDLCIDRLRYRAQKKSCEVAYVSKKDGDWKSISWHDFYQNVQAFAKALLHLSVEPGGKVAILGFNRLEWVISCLGVQSAGCVSVGVYNSSSPDEIVHIIGHSDAEVLVIDDFNRYERLIEPILEKFPRLKYIILMQGEGPPHTGNIFSFTEFLRLSHNVGQENFEERFNAIEPKSIATLIYTSGTSGAPKGVMLSHESIAWSMRIATTLWKVGSYDVSLSYLPLAHVAEQVFTAYAPLETGVRCHFATSFEDLKKNLAEIEPTVFFGVPRVFEKFHQALGDKLAALPPLKKLAMTYGQRLNRKVWHLRHQGKPIPAYLKIQYALCQRFLFQPIKKKLGFSRLRLCLSGAAPIAKTLLEFFTSMDIPIYEVYGQSESSGPTSLNILQAVKLGSAGRPLPGSLVKIAADGEVLVKGPHVFSGYYKNPEATCEILQEGWLHSGDIGTLDQDGFLYITDRKKDLLITAGGKNISPQNIELMLKEIPFVQSAVVIGDRKKYLTALLSPDRNELCDFASSMGIPFESLDLMVKNPEVLSKIQQQIEQINQKLSPPEQIKRFILLPNEFSTDTGELTPTMKIKRKSVSQKYQAEIDLLYA